MKAWWLIVLFVASSAIADDLAVLPKPEPQMLRDALRIQVHQALDARKAAYEARTDPHDIENWQRELRSKLIECLGGFPEKTPLNAKIIERFPADGYAVEKVIYESRPKFYVTATMYLPVTKPPYPGVLLPCGHTETGKAAAVYQRVAILLAKHGMAVLCYDPVGQGERNQILERNAKGDHLPSREFAPTGEHTVTGVPPILLGESLATYRIWDGIRSLDYLCSRSDIDADRIGCTGNSGGGLMTSYLVAIDDRIKAAAPGCFVTTTRIKNERPGPGDAEQNIFAQTAIGLDHADFLMLAAPRSVLICAATRDFVPIEGAWESFREAKRLYTRLGISERIDLVEADAKHGFSKPLRVAVLQWMRRWLLDDDKPASDADFKTHAVSQLRCTPQGQVLLLEGARSLNDLYREKNSALSKQRNHWTSETPAKQQRDKIRELIACRPYEKLPMPKVKLAGEVKRDSYTIEKIILSPDEQIRLPALLFEPNGPAKKTVLYVDGNGKNDAIVPEREMEKTVKQGHRVFAVDLRGYGETESSAWRFSKTYAGANAAEYFIAYMLGKSLVGMRCEDVFASAKYLQKRFPNQPIEIVSVGRAGVPVLHAVALAPNVFVKATINRTLPSWNLVIDTPVTIDQLENTVHGALKFYDLPDLEDLAGPGKVHRIAPVDAQSRLMKNSTN